MALAKPKNCIKGQQCGNTCISLKKICKIERNNVNQKDLQQMGNLLGDGGESKLDSYLQEFQQQKIQFFDYNENGIQIRRVEGMVHGDYLLNAGLADGVAEIAVDFSAMKKKLPPSIDPSDKKAVAPFVKKAISEAIDKLKKDKLIKDGEILLNSSPYSEILPDELTEGFVVVKPNGFSKLSTEDYAEQLGLPRDIAMARWKQVSLLSRASEPYDVVEGKVVFKPKNNREFMLKMRKQEEEFFKELEAREPRTPTDRKISLGEYSKRAKEFVEEMGLGTSAGGFNDLQTMMHDIAHPVAHDMLGLNPKQIQQFFKVNDLAAEEAIVNALERMSRGASPRQALLNAVRLARTLSRGTDTAQFYRSTEFVQKLDFLIGKMYQNPDFYRFLRVVRKSNRISGTVSRRGGGGS